MRQQRDRELGALLDGLDVREHGEGYWAAVTATLEPELSGIRADADGWAASRPSAMHERRPRVRPRYVWSAVAVATAVAIVVLLAGLPVGEQVTPVVGPAPATAAEAADYALNALDRSPGLEGRLVFRYVGTDSEGAKVEETAFVADQDGSLRLESRWQDGTFAPLWVRDTLAYDARARTLRSLGDWSELQPTPGVDEDGGRYYPRWWLERSGLAAAEPDRELLDGGFPLWRVRAYLRAMMSDPEARFSTTEEDGRAVWVLSAESVEEDWSSGVGIEPVAVPVTITIDAATRLPLTLESASLPGHVVGEETTFDLHPLSEAPTRDRFTLQRPDDPGTSITDGVSGVGGGDQGFRDLPFGDDAAIRQLTSGMAAFPQWLPRGFSLSSGTFKDEQSVVDFRPRSGAAVTSVHRTIVSLCFRRGYDQAFVSMRVDPRLYSSTTRGTGKDRVRTDTSDPFVRSIQPEVAALWASHTDDVRLEGGWFAGAAAHIVLEPDNWPHLWVKKGPYIACVAGDLAKGEMVRIAESLGPWNGEPAE